jgi:hypothetical protein
MDEKAFNELKTQVDNLNKGIASYRDESQSAKTDAAEARKEAGEAKAALADFKKLSEKAADEKAPDLTAEEKARFKAYAEEQGLVTKTEFNQERVADQTAKMKEAENTAVSEFLAKHPEYDEKAKWEEVLEQFGQYKVPTTVAGFKNVLDKIHNDLTGEGKSKDAKAEAKAEIISRARLSMGGGSQKTGDEGEVEAKLDQYKKRYPNLSEDQILQRLSDIDALYPAKK